MVSLWRAEWKGFGSKSECVWMENDKDNDGVQLGLKAGLSLAIFLGKKRNRKFEFKLKLWWLVGEK